MNRIAPAAGKLGAGLGLMSILLLPGATDSDAAKEEFSIRLVIREPVRVDTTTTTAARGAGGGEPGVPTVNVSKRPSRVWATVAGRRLDCGALFNRTGERSGRAVAAVSTRPSTRGITAPRLVCRVHRRAGRLQQNLAASGPAYVRLTTLYE